MRLRIHGGVAQPKRDFTSIIMKTIKAFIGLSQNAHILACMRRFWTAPRLALNPVPHS